MIDHCFAYQQCAVNYGSSHVYQYPQLKLPGPWDRGSYLVFRIDSCSRFAPAVTTASQLDRCKCRTWMEELTSKHPYHVPLVAAANRLPRCWADSTIESLMLSVRISLEQSILRRCSIGPVVELSARNFGLNVRMECMSQTSLRHDSSCTHRSGAPPSERDSNRPAVNTIGQANPT